MDYLCWDSEISKECVSSGTIQKTLIPKNKQHKGMLMLHI